jgi:arsenate reductase
MQQVLVLCTGNSCRPIMAEAMINQLGKGQYEAVSAGSCPTGQVHPKSIATLRRHGIGMGQARSKSWDEFTDRSFHLVITVCDRAAAENCPVFPGASRKLHWSIPDPAEAHGPDDQVDRAFDEVLEILRARIEKELL